MKFKAGDGVAAICFRAFSLGVTGRYLFLHVGGSAYLVTWPTRDRWKGFQNGSRWRSGWQRTTSA